MKIKLFDYAQIKQYKLVVSSNNQGAAVLVKITSLHKNPQFTVHNRSLSRII